MKEILIGITGAAGAGKTTAADLLVKLANARGIHLLRKSFAEPIKDIATRDFGWDGKKDERGRRLLQVIGTEAGRAYNPEIWVRKAMEQYDLVMSGLCSCTKTAAGGFVFDDVRVPNEAAAIQGRHGVLIRLIGRGGLDGEAIKHSTEVLGQEIDCQVTIDNGSADFRQLEKMMADALDKILAWLVAPCDPKNGNYLELPLICAGCSYYSLCELLVAEAAAPCDPGDGDYDECNASCAACDNAQICRVVADKKGAENA